VRLRLVEKVGRCPGLAERDAAGRVEGHSSGLRIARRCGSSGIPRHSGGPTAWSPALAKALISSPGVRICLAALPITADGL